MYGKAGIFLSWQPQINSVTTTRRKMSARVQQGLRFPPRIADGGAGTVASWCRSAADGSDARLSGVFDHQATEMTRSFNERFGTLEDGIMLMTAAEQGSGLLVPASRALHH